jgi:hypothetical protein
MNDEGIKCCSQQEILKCYLVCLGFIKLEGRLCRTCGDIFYDSNSLWSRIVLRLWTGAILAPEEMKKDFEFGGRFYGK